MFLRALLPVVLFGLPAAAQEAALCPMTDDQANCVRVLACVGEQGRWFHGRAFGRGEGTLAGVVNDGVTCQGTWTSRNAMGLGQADVVCDDGATIRVIYFYQDEYTGTAIGRGESDTGDLVQSWSGEHVLEYFRDGDPSAQAVLKCGAQDIPIS
ncbi:MAG: hypothetical protein RLZZ437_1767 [Pseudomonadota bacterium]